MVRIQPAPSALTHLAGKYYVSRGTGGFAEYLQLNGTWGKSCEHYWDNQKAAQQALGCTGFDVKTAEGYVAQNLDAQAVQARAAKRGRRHRVRRL